MMRREYLFHIRQTATILLLMMLLITGPDAIAQDRENQQNSRNLGKEAAGVNHFSFVSSKESLTMRTVPMENNEKQKPIKEARISPLPMSEMPEEWIKTLARLPGAGLKGAYTPVNVFGTLMHNPGTMGSFLEYWVTSKLEMGLSGREQELVILRMGFHYKCDYVWKHHVPVAKEYGASEAEIEAIKATQIPSGFSAREYALLMLTDELVEQRTLREDAWKKWSPELKPSELVDLISLVSQYVFFALLNNGLQIELEEPLHNIPGI
ncbi:carboxymuconolactone decarboxylase family protein [candidate division KSB1 bacterium]|nr:carboxymuconolactone decarboxylase family protein [candidate division KSB1 bacterium]